MENNKICSKKDCDHNGKPQSINNFGICRKNKNGLRAECNSCRKKYYSKNKNAINNICGRYYENNKEKVNTLNNKYHKENKEKISLQRKEYRKNNKEKINADSMKRYCNKMQRVPKWLSKQDLSKIKNIYLKAQQMKQETGIQYHVDHIIPLQGETVSGLHVPDNLQILTEHENTSKGNTYI